MMRSSIPRVRQTVAALRAALLAPPADHSPERLASQVPALQDAALELERLRHDPAAPAVRAELEALARELHGVARLIAQGLELTRGMARLLAPAAGYGQDGEPAPLNPPGTVLVRG